MIDNDNFRETMVDKQVTYILETDGKVFIIEHVPARVCQETGEQYFSPETVEVLQTTVWGKKRPKKVIETPVFEFTSKRRKRAAEH
jgi:YgiT-type zinc finger domain-containing protein